MRFIVLVMADASSEAGILPSTELLTQMGNYNEALVKSGIMLGGDGLHPSSKGVRVRFDGDARTVIDGPFTESKELIAGYWLWNTDSLEEAIEWVKRCPNPMEGESMIEIRQVFEAEDFGAEFTPEAREQEERLRAEAAAQQSAGAASERNRRVMILHKSTPQTEETMMPDEEILTQMGNFNEELVKEGIMLEGEGLHPSRKGARVIFSGKNRTVMHGPFTASEELLAGYWVWRVKSMEEAIEWAGRCPMPAGVEAELELRPLFEAEDFGEAFTPELREQEDRIRAESAAKR